MKLFWVMFNEAPLKGQQQEMSISYTDLEIRRETWGRRGEVGIS